MSDQALKNGPYDVHFGGPDLPARRLRDVLAERVAAVPAGGAIDWVTYYFRDRPLAEELLRAHRRGVSVTLTLEGQPRTGHANDAVVRILSGPAGLGEGLRVATFPRVPIPWGGMKRPRLHEKLYCFSHPEPIAYIGSFNPSGDEPEDEPEILDEIGDQDRGHNVLVGFREPSLVTGFVTHARWLHRSSRHVLSGCLTRACRALTSDDNEIHFLPRLRPHPAVRSLGRFGAGARIRMAGSHIKGAGVVNTLVKMAGNGADFQILAEHTQRRVPTKVERRLRTAGVAIRRVTHPEDLPMHNKFVLAEEGADRWAVFGSFNWTTRSFWINREICAISSDRRLFDAFAERWEALETQSSRDF
jgi:hypothetical protein